MAIDMKSQQNEQFLKPNGKKRNASILKIKQSGSLYIVYTLVPFYIFSSVSFYVFKMNKNMY